MYCVATVLECRQQARVTMSNKGSNLLGTLKISLPLHDELLYADSKRTLQSIDQSLQKQKSQHNETSEEFRYYFISRLAQCMMQLCGQIL